MLSAHLEFRFVSSKQSCASPPGVSMRQHPRCVVHAWRVRNVPVWVPRFHIGVVLYSFHHSPAGYSCSFLASLGGHPDSVSLCKKRIAKGLSMKEPMYSEPQRMRMRSASTGADFRF